MSYNWLRDPKIPGIVWTQPRGTTILGLFGLTGDRFPPEGLEPRFVNGIEMWVYSSAHNSPEMNANRQFPARHPSRHRAVAKCPICGKIVSLGRLAQHAKVHWN